MTRDISGGRRNGNRSARPAKPAADARKPIKLNIEPLPVHAPWEVTPGGPDLFAALKDVERRYSKAARAPDADELLLASARVLRALVLAMALGSKRALTVAPKSKQSPNAWARAYLRQPSVDTPERARAAAEWLYGKLGIDVRKHAFDTQLERSEAVERFLDMIEKIRQDRSQEDNEIRSAHEQDAAALIFEAEEYFPRLFSFDLRARETVDQWLSLTRRVAEKLSWEKSNETVMRTVLRACGMPEREVRSLLNFEDWRTKKVRKGDSQH